MAHFFLAEIITAVHSKVAFNALRKGRAKLFRPNLEVSDAHPGQVLPARQVDRRQVDVEDDEGQDEQGEGRAYQECHIHYHFVLFVQRSHLVLTHVVNTHANHKSSEQLNKLALQEPKEVKAIALTDTVANPRTVMIVRCHAVVASLAMLAAQRLLNVTYCAVLVLDEKHHVLVFIFVAIVVRQAVIDFYDHFGHFLHTIV